MRVFLAGATGAIGRRLVPLLLADGHRVTGMVRSHERAEPVRALGAEPAIADALDADAVRAAVQAAQPEAVIHELTSLPRRIDPRKLERDFALNDRLRSEGTRHLVEAAQAAGASRIVAQSIAFAYAPGPPGTVHTERDPLFLQAPAPFARSVRAVHDLERAVTAAGGLVLRYGYFYGPGTGTFLILLYAHLFGDPLVRASGNAKVANFASNLASFSLFALSGNACAFPGCNRQLVEPATAHDDAAVSCLDRVRACEW